jgi:uncharacterized protein YjiS (DUF1127 family)
MNLAGASAWIGITSAGRRRPVRPTECSRQCANGGSGRTELARLDDRMLKDIGLTRGDADFLSEKPFWRERRPNRTYPFRLFARSPYAAEQQR